MSKRGLHISASSVQTIRNGMYVTKPSLCDNAISTWAKPLIKGHLYVKFVIVFCMYLLDVLRGMSFTKLATFWGYYYNIRRLQFFHSIILGKLNDSFREEIFIPFFQDNRYNELLLSCLKQKEFCHCSEVTLLYLSKRHAVICWYKDLLLCNIIMVWITH